jgi:hypothetical protein
MLLLESSLHDFIERTVQVAPDGGFNLELSSYYDIYRSYCAAFDTKPSNYHTFLEGCRNALPHAYTERVTAYAGVGTIATLRGLTYKKPMPWKVLKKGIKFYPEKSSTAASIADINQAMSNDERPSGIPEDWPDFARLSRIRSGAKMVIFTPYDYQVKLWQLIEDNTRIAMVKSRQLGITQLIISIFLHRAALNEAYVSVVFMMKKEDTTKLAMRNRAIVKSMGGIIVADRGGDSNTYFRVRGGGCINFMTSSEEGGRGIDSISDVLYDEAAFVEGIQGLIAATSAGSALVGDRATQIVVSTPKTRYGWFYNRMAQNNPDDFDFDKVCEDVVEQRLPPFLTWKDVKGGVKAIIHWRAHPIYRDRDDFVQYRMVQDGTDEETAEREYNLLFVSSRVTVFNQTLVAACMTGEFEAGPELGVDYYMGVDTSGVGDDYSVGLIGKEFKKELETPLGNRMLKGYSIVDMYRRSKQPHSIDLIGLTKLIQKWKPKAIGVECFDGTGEIMYQSLVVLFPDILIIKLRMNDTAKNVTVGMLGIGLEESRILYPPGPIPEELMVYSRVGGKMEAAEGYHDDCVSALLQMLAVSPFSEGDYRLVAAPVEEEIEEESLIEAVIGG